MSRKVYVFFLLITCFTLLLISCEIFFSDVEVSVINRTEERILAFNARIVNSESIVYTSDTLIDPGEKFSFLLDRDSYKFYVSLEYSEPYISSAIDLNEVDNFTLYVEKNKNGN